MRVVRTYQEINTIVAFDVEVPPDHVPVHVRGNAPHHAAIETERETTRGVAFRKVGILLRKIVETVLDSAGEAEWYTPSGALGLVLARSIARVDGEAWSMQRTQVSISSASQSPTRQCS
jgi:hypothetical protein